MATPRLTPAQWRQVEELYEAASGRPPAEWEDFVGSACDDAIVRAETLSLLRHSPSAKDVLDAAVGDAARRLVGVGDPMIGRRLGPYRIVAPLGEGGMGAVYLAERDDAEFRHEVAIKVLRQGLGSAEAVARFRDERQILAGLAHPGIVRLLDGGTQDGLPYLVMERVTGTPITAYANERSLSLVDRLALVREICDALAYAHRNHVVHRDIKPSNVLVDVDGHAKLLDFGIAKLIGSDDDREARTRTGLALMTPAYASPEQARGEAVTAATDIYSLGAVLYELLTDRTPLDPRGNALDIVKEISEIEPPRPSSVAPRSRERSLTADLDNIVLMALRKDPARRYATIRELDDDLGRYLEGEPVIARTPTLRYRANKLLRRHASKLVLISCGGAVAIAAVVLLSEDERAAPADARCPSSTAKLAGIWDPITRGQASARFLAAERAYVRDAWRSHAEQFDTHAVAWAARWDAACAATDRTTDQLLYAQRMTCLDANLVELQGYALAFTHPASSIEDVARGSPGQFPMTPPSECDHERLLRAQSAPPPAAFREEARDLLVESHRLRSQLRLAGLAHVKVDTDAVFDRLAWVSRRAREIGFVSGAGDIDGWRATFLAPFGRISEAEQVIGEMIALGEANRDDVVMISGLALDVRTRANFAVEYDVAAGDAALQRASTLVGRIGNPKSLLEQIEEARIAHERRGRNQERMYEAMRAHARLCEELGYPAHALWTRNDLARWRSRFGDDVVAEASEILREREAMSGRASLQLGADLIELADVFARAADVGTAYAHVLRGVAIFDAATGASSTWHLDGVRRAYVWAFELGRDATMHAHAAIARSDDAYAGYLELAAAARRWGYHAAARHALGLASALPAQPDTSISRARIAAATLELAVDRGDPIEPELVARLVVLPDRERVRTSALVDAARGRRTAFAHLEVLDEPERELVRGRVAYLLGNDATIPLLRAARARLAARPRDPMYAEATAWLGLALADRAVGGEAATFLDEALWLDGDAALQANVRLALARVTRDPTKARKLAVVARAVFVRAGMSAKVHAVDTFLATL